MGSAEKQADSKHEDIYVHHCLEDCVLGAKWVHMVFFIFLSEQGKSCENRGQYSIKSWKMLCFMNPDPPFIFKITCFLIYTFAAYTHTPQGEATESSSADGIVWGIRDGRMLQVIPSLFMIFNHVQIAFWCTLNFL